jgi:hypothetical protein
MLSNCNSQTNKTTNQKGNDFKTLKKKENITNLNRPLLTTLIDHIKMMKLKLG